MRMQEVRKAIALFRIPKGYWEDQAKWEFEQSFLLLPPKMAWLPLKTLDLSLAIPNIGDESRSDISA
jgi:hypothetical protein